MGKPFIEMGHNPMHLWLFQISKSQSYQDFLERLSPEEISKSCKFAFERDRRRYVFSHAFLREVLARYCCTDSERLEIAYGEFGKPFLKGAEKKVHFSFSHAEEIALLALFWQGPIGIDIEKVQYQFEFQHIADTFFSEQEKMAMEEIPDSQKAQFFYSIWTGKEAYGKFMGKGIRYPLDQVTIPMKQTDIYTNNLKNREFDKEAPQNSCQKRATIALGQGASEGKNFEVKPTRSKTDSSSCLCIPNVVQKLANRGNKRAANRLEQRGTVDTAPPAVPIDFRPLSIPPIGQFLNHVRDRFVGIYSKELNLDRFMYESESQSYIISSVTEQKIEETTLFSCGFDVQKSLTYELVRTY